MRRNASRWDTRTRSRALRVALAGAAAAAVAAFAPGELHAQPFDCASADPAMWPAPAKPYFLVMVDTSGSMTANITTNNSCGYPNNRLGHGRCAIKNTMLAFAGQANFGLTTFARRMVNCTNLPADGTCQVAVSDPPESEPLGHLNCTYADFPNNSPGAGTPSCDSGCGNESNPNLTDSSTRAGANFLVPVMQDTAPPPASNVAEIVSWVDNKCTGGKEIFATGCTPLNGLLRDAYRYYSNQWVSPVPGGSTFTSPLTSVANGERPCRSVNVILVTDGGETCDQPPNPVDAAADLLAGFTKDGINWSVRTHVIDFGNTGAAADNIAAAGGTGVSYPATNEVELSNALANIISGAVKPEVCNNADDNCNGCIDEGYRHYCNVPPAGGQCCAWTTPAVRTSCLTLYQNSITAANPSGNLALLPCTTPAQQQNPATWLCFDPKESCDNVDNNCQNGVDDGVTKCGSPLHCPQTETCNSLDDDCDGLVDELVCNGCVPSQEICDGCDNDCNGVADNGIAPIPCGLASPTNCNGQLACNPPQNVPTPGACAPGGGYGQCSNNPQAETCDNVDNDCDGQVDESLQPVPCVPPSHPGGLVYGGTSQCEMGTRPCGGTCQGGVGPSQEICDNEDNDCDGTVDESPFGVGLPCGVGTGECSTGLTACVNGALTCQGSVGATNEVCDGLDNNCNGQIDDAPLADAPPPAQNGCWQNTGNCCRFPATNPDIHWCPPAGGTCTGNGTLTAPCNKGTLICSSGVWACTNANGPDPEACDGVDNDCDSNVDETPLPDVGSPCGSGVGECAPGVTTCNAGVISCAGDVGPSVEICDGLDNDCDNVVDNGLQGGGPCEQPYDTVLYPGERDCVPGVLVCDPVTGSACMGGATPSPEICDGIDNDCDSFVDEVGPPPDGIDGTVRPTPLPPVAIGDVCGESEGACELGAYACVNGAFVCAGGQAPGIEQCDCSDNDCDGTVDNQSQNGPALCGTGKDCVNAAGQCQCAALCGTGEFLCPPGQICVEANSSQTGRPLGDYCITDFDAICGDCATKTITDPATDQIVCAPAGTVPGCTEPPVCQCKNQNGCREPCFGVSCGAGSVCSNFGPQAGTCVSDTNCWHFPCADCDQACHNGTCLDNPCANANCRPDEVCKPNADYSGFTCVGSCADVTCGANEVCIDGQCRPTCDPACASGSVCDLTLTPPACVTDQCAAQNPCASEGSCCNPITGACGDCPCEGVVCPNGQACQNGSCIEGAGGAGGGSPTGTGGDGGATSTSTGTGANGGAGGVGPGGVWGLPTGGGGCACEAGAGASSGARGYPWALLALAIGLSRRQRRRSDARSSVAVEVSR